jgi:hypothetical protein
MCREGGQAGWKDAEEDETCRLGIEAVVYRIDEGKRLERKC